jgi:uncharacterized protein (DUF305 family)
MKHYLSLPALVVALAIMLAGCGSDDTGTPGHSVHSAGPGTASSTQTGGEHNAQDVMFAQMMIPHHRQALEMSEMVLAKEDVSPEVAALAGQIRDAQRPEIKTLTGWLESWGEPADVPGGHAMDGMMTEKQMGQLRDAAGSEAARLFLAQMIKHHEGAVKMAQQEVQSGASPEAVALAESIVESQRAEIEEMKELLGRR